MSEQLMIDWSYLASLEEGIGRSEHTGIRARWEFGVYLRDVVPKGKHGAIKAIADELTVSEQELRFRRRFAEKFPTEPELANALASFGSWHAIVNDGLSGSWWTVEIYDNVFVTVPTARMKALARRAWKENGGPKPGGDNNNVGVLVPVRWLTEPWTEA